MDATADGTVTNGSIYVSAYGMELSSINGTVSNNGSIAVTAKAMGSGISGLSVYGYGIEADVVGETGSIRNDGSIVVDVTADGTATDESIYASAFGMELEGVNGTVSNNGSIAVTAKAMGSGISGLSVYGYGIEADVVGETGSIRNDGSIVVDVTADGTATNDQIYVSAHGMFPFNVNGTVLNSGSIEVAAKAMGAGGTGLSAYGYGIRGITVGEFGSVRNEGSIAVDVTADGTAASGSIYVSAFGMTYSSINGTVSNSGDIVVSAKAAGSGTNVEAAAFGLSTSQVTGTGSVSNTGSIIVSAEAEDVERAVGIRTATLDGTLYNSGPVLAFAVNGGNATAIEVVGGGSGSATFTTESLFAGRLSLTNDELTVKSVADTPSIFWTFDDIPQSVILDDADGPKLYRDGNVIATVEPVNLAFSGQIAAEMANMGGSKVASLLAGAPSTVTTGMQNMAMADDQSKIGGGGTLFVQGDFVSRKVDDAAGRELDFDVSGITAGFVGRLQNGLGFGLTVSGVDSKGSAKSGLGADSVDTSGVVFGVYGNTALGGASLTFGATFGRLSNDGIRSVNDNLSASGVSTVSSEYDSTFVSPSIELSWAMQSGAATIRPYVGYRYTRLKIDGVTETGGLAAATFGSRDVDVSDFTIGADMSMAYGKGTLTGSAQILRRIVSDDGTSVALFGDTGQTATAATDFTALELGIGYSMEVESGVLSIGATGMFGDNGVSGYGVTAGYRLAF